MLKETTLFYTQANTNVCACFVDISKAFDSVNHDILFSKLRDLGIPTSIINMINFWYDNQFASVKYHNSVSHEFQISNGVRQGGVLSGLLFNVYIDSLISNISKMKVGCRLGLISSNIIAYADDIVLLAPSIPSLNMLVNTAYTEASRLHLEFNFDKTKLMKFHSCSERKKINPSCQIVVNNHVINPVSSYKYLGYLVTGDLSYNDDILRVTRKFYSEFNSILRKFSFSSKVVKLYLFKQYCLQFYGSELWFGPYNSLQVMRQFEVGYHKAIKKLLGLSSHESNHYACQEASLLTLRHLLNKNKILAVFRFILKPCNFISKIQNFMKLSSFLVNDVSNVLDLTYDIYSMFENDIEAIMSRIQFIQNHEKQMRVEW